MKKYLFLLVAVFALVLTSCDKSDPEARDAFIGTYAVSALLDYTVTADGDQDTGSMPVQGTVNVTKSDDANGVLISGDVYCNGKVEGDVLQIEPQHFRQMTLKGLIDINVTFEPAKLVDNTLYILGEASGTVTVAGEEGSFEADITAVATKQ